MKAHQETSGIDILREYMPEITNAKPILLIVIPTVIIWVLIYIFNMIDWWVPLLMAIIANVLTYWTMSRISKNAEKIRKDYLEKYKKRAYAKFFYDYLIPAIPPNMAAFFLIVIVENNEFFPMVYPSYGTNALYQPLLPWPLMVPVGIFLIAIYPFMSRDAVNGGFSIDTELFLYIIYPEKAKKLQGGVYQYIRHPHYAEGIYMCFGFALLSQNLMALIIAFMFLISYYGIARSEDKELMRRYGASFEEYVNKTPCFVPKLRDIISFLKLVFLSR